MATSTKQTYMDLNTQKALKKKILQTSYIRKHFVVVFISTYTCTHTKICNTAYVKQICDTVEKFLFDQLKTNVKKFVSRKFKQKVQLQTCSKWDFAASFKLLKIFFWETLSTTIVERISSHGSARQYTESQQIFVLKEKECPLIIFLNPLTCVQKQTA